MGTYKREVTSTGVLVRCAHEPCHAWYLLWRGRYPRGSAGAGDKSLGDLPGAMAFVSSTGDYPPITTIWFSQELMPHAPRSSNADVDRPVGLDCDCDERGCAPVVSGWSSLRADAIRCGTCDECNASPAKNNPARGTESAYRVFFSSNRILAFAAVCWLGVRRIPKSVKFDRR